MIIQHNIMAINSHRQLTVNNSNLQKNLEKLSSGYRINKAADDAAGLAISEKMRAQITGLERASLNAQDGASLIQTAEGALTEVHSMLNRMVELATQSANGTIQADDRQKIESELNALKDEIDRISKATNFNGINLLDGSLSTEGGSGAASRISLEGLNETVVEAKAAESTFTFADNTVADGDKVNVELAVGDKLYNLEFEFAADSGNGKIMYNGKEVGTTAGDAAITGKELRDAVAKALSEDASIKSAFSLDSSTADGVLKFTSKTSGESAPVASMGKVLVEGAAGGTVTAATSQKGENSYKTAAPTADEVFTVNGKKFALVSDMDNPGVDKDVIFAETADDLAALISNSTGLDVSNAAGTLSFKAGTSGVAGTGGLTMQVGDTADDFNKITVSVDDMSSAGLGIDAISMADQDAAAAALDKVKKAIEQVSVNRGNLGALQNRLEHTIANLGVTTENMTAAESRIRDVDMAKEMMAFTKNNVLSQAAQAMLAQANQQPQMVLQLLR